jgi:hypothetical protein
MPENMQRQLDHGAREHAWVGVDHGIDFHFSYLLSNTS